MPFLDVFDEVPTNPKVSGDIKDAHVTAQLQGVAFEGVSVGPSGISETEFGLAGYSTCVAAEALDGELEIHRLAPNGQTAEQSSLLPTVNDISRPAERTSQAFRFVGNPEGSLATLEKGSDMVVATETPSVV